MSDDPDPRVCEHRQLLREVRQRLESLAGAGVDRIPAPRLPATASRRGSYPVVAAVDASRAAATPPPTAAPVPMPAAPAPAPAPGRVPGPPRPPAAIPSVAASLFEETLEAAAVEPSRRPDELAALAAEVAACQRCPHLAAARTQTVFGAGSPTARLMFVGEAPGADEDRTGQPFVGRAGQSLTDMITKGMGLTRAEVYIANILKSRPPDNRTPLPDEVAHCLPYLERQIAIIRPEYLCLLGATAAQALLETSLAVGRLRGRWHRYRGIPAIVTYHPSYLLRNPPAKKDAWEDLKLLMQPMGLLRPGR